MTRFAGDALSAAAPGRSSSYGDSGTYSASRASGRSVDDIRSSTRRGRYAFAGYDRDNPRVKQSEEQAGSFTGQTGGASVAERLAGTTANRKQAELDAKNKALYGG